ncbi:hypothetical protein Ahy_A03g015421 [Arachis hypogaea]|uniref:Uncharacterized protein n=1 Tax=Arachis hypogaea TaxID=3818 RepID=A0A445E0L8_ARAHY|nr:hypothetical protein Ahy_A03g015421 [Arachis hypogaea]
MLDNTLENVETLDDAQAKFDYILDSPSIDVAFEKIKSLVKAKDLDSSLILLINGASAKAKESMLPASKHEPDGRVILVEFETLRLLNTYVPNNGWKKEPNSFQRRRKWDKRILEFVTQNSDKAFIWCVDLNVRLINSNLFVWWHTFHYCLCSYENKFSSLIIFN